MKTQLSDITAHYFSVEIL